MPSANFETGQLLRLNIPTRDRALWLGPAWSVICGLIASGAIVWRGQSLLFALLAILLADGLWATLWWTLVETEWSEVFARWKEIEVDQPARSLPFTQSGSPADRVLRALNRSNVWLRTEVWPQHGSAVLTGLVSIGLGFMISIILGWQALALSLAALALIQLALFVRRVRSGLVSILHGLLAVGLAWLLGQAAFTQINWLSLAIALLFSVAYSGVIEVLRYEKPMRRWLIPQLLIIIIFALLQQPLATLALAAVLSAQALLATVLSGPHFARSAQWWLMLSMLIAALAIR